MATKRTSKAIGRPTKYYPAIVNKVESYFETVNDTQLPSLEGLAVYLDISRDTVLEWSKKHARFSGALKKISTKQRDQLMNDGMYGGKEVNASMAIFLLKANHGLKDGNQVNVNIDNRQVHVTLPKRGKKAVKQALTKSKPGNNDK